MLAIDLREPLYRIGGLTEEDSEERLYQRQRVPMFLNQGLDPTTVHPKILMGKLSNIGILNAAKEDALITRITPYIRLASYEIYV